MNAGTKVPAVCQCAVSRRAKAWYCYHAAACSPVGYGFDSVSGLSGRPRPSVSRPLLLLRSAPRSLGLPRHEFAPVGSSAVRHGFRSHMLRGRTRSLRCAQALAYILPPQIWHAPAAARFVPLPSYDVNVCSGTLRGLLDPVRRFSTLSGNAEGAFCSRSPV